MAEQPNPHYEDTNDPRYPPKAVLNKNVRRAAVWVYVGPLIALLAIVGIALLYWLGRPPGTDADALTPATGTSGEQQLPATEREGQPQQGGGDPIPQPDSTRDEIEFRGGAER